MAVINADFGTEMQPQIGQGCAKNFSDPSQDVRECRPVKMSPFMTLCVKRFGLENLTFDRKTQSAIVEPPISDPSLRSGSDNKIG